MKADPPRVRFQLGVRGLMLATALFAAALAPWAAAARSVGTRFPVLVILLEPFILPVLIALILNHCWRPDVWTDEIIGYRAMELGCNTVFLTFVFFGFALIFYVASRLAFGNL